jgi:hypothetical protein
MNVGNNSVGLAENASPDLFESGSNAPGIATRLYNPEIADYAHD